MSKSKIGGTDFAHASLCLNDLRGVNCIPLTPGDWQKLTEELKKIIPEGKSLSDLLKRLKEAAKRIKTNFKNVGDAKNVLSHHPLICGEFPVQNINEPDYRRELTQFLLILACKDKYIEQGIARRISSLTGGDKKILPALAKKLVESDKAVQQLSKDVLEKLKKIAEKAQEEKSR